MDKLVIALTVVISLFYILFFFVVQYGLSWSGKKGLKKKQHLFKKLALGTTWHLKARTLLRNTKLTLT